MSHVLVTGGAGFIGSHVVDALVARGDEVTVVDNLDPAAHRGRPAYLNPEARFIDADLRDRDIWRMALDGVDVVCHQAGKVGLGVDFADIDAYVTNNDVAWSAGLRELHEIGFDGAIVLGSSMVVYGEGRYRCADHGLIRPAPRRTADLDAGQFEPRCPACESPLQSEAITEDAAVDPRNVYAATKLHQEHLLAAFCREHPVSAVALRYHNVYGARMPKDTPYAGVAAIFRSALAAGKRPLVTEDGQQMRNFVHVTDVARANLAAITHCIDRRDGPSHRVDAYNIASPEPHSVGEMANALASAFGATPSSAMWPRVTGRYRLGDVRHVFASPELAAQQLGFVAEVRFSEGMQRFSTEVLRQTDVSADARDHDANTVRCAS